MADGFRNGVCLEAGGYKEGLRKWGRWLSKDGLAGGRLAYKSSGSWYRQGVQLWRPSPGDVDVAMDTSTRLPAKAATQHPDGRQHPIALNGADEEITSSPGPQDPSRRGCDLALHCRFGGMASGDSYCAMTSTASEDGRSNEVPRGQQDSEWVESTAAVVKGYPNAGARERKTCRGGKNSRGRPSKRLVGGLAAASLVR